MSTAPFPIALIGAFDATLDRTVALKVSRQGESGNQSTAARGRLLREAKALARLSPP